MTKILSISGRIEICYEGLSFVMVVRDVQCAKPCNDCSVKVICSR